MLAPTWLGMNVLGLPFDDDVHRKKALECGGDFKLLAPQEFLHCPGDTLPKSLRELRPEE